MGADACDPKDVELKSFFLGPQAENGEWVLRQVSQVFENWFQWRRALFPQDGRAISEADQKLAGFQERQQWFDRFVRELAGRYQTEMPKFSPRYIGHMLSEISLPALFGHVIALLHNPNNISGEASRVGVEIEDEAVGDLLTMLGMNPENSVGHFTSGGTLANFEALMRARERTALWMAVGLAACEEKKTPVESLWRMAHAGWEKCPQILDGAAADAEKFQRWNFSSQNPWSFSEQIAGMTKKKWKGPVVLVPENKHYSWKKGISLLGFGDEAFWSVALDRLGKLSVQDLKRKLQEAEKQDRPVVMVVSVLGTTELGEVDPVDQVQEVLDEYRLQRGVHIWHHVDAAYGGFFCCVADDAQCGLGEDVRGALTAMSRVDSVTLDPHKLGYVPYSSGTFLVRDRRDYYVKGFGAPYLQFDPKRDRGQYTIEGSRSAAGATATWLTARCIGFNPDGYGRILARTVQIRKNLEKKLIQSGLEIQLIPHADTNILCFTVACQGDRTSVCNEVTTKVYQALSPAGRGRFIVSKTTLFKKSYGPFLETFVRSWAGSFDTDGLVLIRLCLMNLFFDSVEMKTEFSTEFISELRQVIAEAKSHLGSS